MLNLTPFGRGTLASVSFLPSALTSPLSIRDFALL